MKIAIVGAGAVGSYYGAMLALAGHSVTMIGRPAHVSAMQEHGLVLQTAQGIRSASVSATADPAGVRAAEAVLFCVKSDDTVRAAEETSTFIQPDAAVLSLQNGVDNAERLEVVLGRSVIATAVYVAAELSAPGRVKHNGRGELVIGNHPSSQVMAKIFDDAGIPAEISENVKSVLWAKLTVNCAYNALCAVAQLPYGRMIEVEGVRDVMADVVAECLAVARALQVCLPDDMLTKVLNLASAMPNQFSSTAWDIKHGKRSEIEYLNGFVVRTAGKLGMAVPANRLLLVSIRLLEASRSSSTSR